MVLQHKNLLNQFSQDTYTCYIEFTTENSTREQNYQIISLPVSFPIFIAMYQTKNVNRISRTTNQLAKKTIGSIQRRLVLFSAGDPDWLFDLIFC